MSQPEHLDVLIVGAGLSGIGAAHHLGKHHPKRTYALLEMREELGGTWSLFKYPGIRSDSDMHTLGFAFRPWKAAEAIADGPAILDYLRETAEEYGIDKAIRYGRRVIGANWSTADAQWTVDIEHVGSGETEQITAGFLLGCTGYYRYDEGYTPEFAGREDFKGQVIHPQHWPEDLDYAGKRVVVIGSGATAVTLVPAMAKEAAHVTMLQRSPTWISAVPSIDPIAEKLKRFLPNRLAYPAVRWKNVLFQTGVYQLSRRRPQVIKNLLRKQHEKMLPDGYDIDTHLTPSYDPWDQRLCAIPSGDLFRSISKGESEIVTAHIDRFVEDGILLQNGDKIDADIIITATGLNLLLIGDLQLSVDDIPVDLPDTMTYKGMMFEDVPNFAFALGYTNASWTLKADLTGDYVGRLLTYMDKHGYQQCVPHNSDPTVEKVPLLDFAAGYVLRGLSIMPKQGSKAPWTLRQNYALDLKTLKYSSVADGVMRFSSPAAAAKSSSAKEAATA